MKRTELARTPFVRKTRPDIAMKPPKGPKKIKCANKACRIPFVQTNPFIKWCSDDCAVVIGLEKVAKQKAKAIRADRAETKKKLESHKPLEYFLKKTEKACNEFIRFRDPDICISCGVTHSSAWQAGHYVSVGGNKTIRYHEDNIHKQCVQCNMFKGSNATEYRIRLIEKIGIERVEFLESWHSPVKMTREAAEEIEAMYKDKLKKLKSERH